MPKTGSFERHSAEYEEWFEENAFVYRTELEAIPFADRTFDFALMVTTLCFLDDPERSFRETARVLKSDGLFVVGLVDRDSPLGRIYDRYKAENVFYRDAIFYSATDVILLLERCGFTISGVTQTVFGELSEIRSVQEFREGHGEGGFAVIKAVCRPSPARR